MDFGVEPGVEPWIEIMSGVVAQIQSRENMNLPRLVENRVRPRRILDKPKSDVLL